MPEVQEDGVVRLPIGLPLEQPITQTPVLTARFQEDLWHFGWILLFFDDFCIFLPLFVTFFAIFPQSGQTRATARSVAVVGA